MRCPGCNKFASLNSEEPEVNSIDIDTNGSITCEVRIVRTSECCGDEMKSASFDCGESIPDEIVKKHSGKIEGTEDDEHELEVIEGDVEATEEGGGRYAKSFYGFNLTFTVRCSCQKDTDPDLYEGSFDDKIAASHMDEEC
jgi:hypothetical protein